MISYECSGVLMRYIVAAIFGFCLIAVEADACLRADVEGRPPKQVVENSQALATKNVHSPVVGLLTVTLDAGTANGTGVALDPTTILTVAHLAAMAKGEGKTIYFDPRNLAGVEKKPAIRAAPSMFIQILSFRNRSQHSWHLMMTKTGFCMVSN
jgi:hypothetical protein